MKRGAVLLSLILLVAILLVSLVSALNPDPDMFDSYVCTMQDNTIVGSDEYSYHNSDPNDPCWVDAFNQLAPNPDQCLCETEPDKCQVHGCGCLTRDIGQGAAMEIHASQMSQQTLDDCGAVGQDKVIALTPPPPPQISCNNNNVREGSEECDGTDKNRCTVVETCNQNCDCFCDVNELEGEAICNQITPTPGKNKLWSFDPDTCSCKEIICDPDAKRICDDFPVTRGQFSSNPLYHFPNAAIPNVWRDLPSCECYECDDNYDAREASGHVCDGASGPGTGPFQKIVGWSIGAGQTVFGNRVCTPYCDGTMCDEASWAAMSNACQAAFHGATGMGAYYTCQTNNQCVGCTCTRNTNYLGNNICAAFPNACINACANGLVTYPFCKNLAKNNPNNPFGTVGNPVPPPPGPTTQLCTNGVLDTGEHDIDCGGICPACSGPTCFDGIQNQGEQGIDCGGSCAANCPLVNNTCLPSGGLISLAQLDSDCDTVPDQQDNCIYTPNPSQSDSDGDCPATPYLVNPLCGDACDRISCVDADGDGFPVSTSVGGQSCGPVIDCNDNDPAQGPPGVELCDGLDNDCDGLIDENLDYPVLPCAVTYCQNGQPQQCQTVPEIPDNCMDDDLDGLVDEDAQNNPLPDADNDTLPDVDSQGNPGCDTCPNDQYNDWDQDTLCADVDNCPDVSNPLQEDTDNDGIGDACDPHTQLPPGPCGNVSVQTGSASPSANCGTGGGGGGSGGGAGGRGGGFATIGGIKTGHAGTKVSVSCIEGVFADDYLCVEADYAKNEVTLTQIRPRDTDRCEGIVVNCAETTKGNVFYCKRTSDKCIEYEGSLCVPQWTTGPWRSCTGLGTNSKQSRTVYDENNCGTNAGRPTEERACFIGIPLAVVPPFLLDNCLVGVTAILLLVLIFIVWHSVRDNRKPWAWMGVTGALCVIVGSIFVYVFKLDSCFTAVLILLTVLLSYLVWILRWGEKKLGVLE